MGTIMGTNRLFSGNKKPNQLKIKRLGFIVVVPPGIEPGTQGFSVLCSTN